MDAWVEWIVKDCCRLHLILARVEAGLNFRGQKGLERNFMAHPAEETRHSFCNVFFLFFPLFQMNCDYDWRHVMEQITDIFSLLSDVYDHDPLVMCNLIGSSTNVSLTNVDWPWSWLRCYHDPRILISHSLYPLILKWLSK